MAPQHRIRAAAQGQRSIRRRQQQRHPALHRQIIHVVAEKGDLINRYLELPAELRQGHGLVFGTHQAMADAELLSPHLRGAAPAAAEKRHFHTSVLKQTNPQPITHIKPLDQLTTRPMP